MAKPQDPTYAGGDAPGVEPFSDPEQQTSKPDVPDVEGAAYGWNQYRGSEAHGVRIVGDTPIGLDETVEEEYKDADDIAPWSVKDQPPISTIEGYSDEVLVRIVGTTRVLPVPSDGTWLKAFGDNPRRTSAYFWFDPAPAGTDKIYFQLGTQPNMPVGLCPFIVNGGQSVGLYPMEFTNPFWVQVVGSPPAGGYRIHCVEEYSVKHGAGTDDGK